jgi:hypothetical protein
VAALVTRNASRPRRGPSRAIRRTCVGKARAGRHVNVHVEGAHLQIWDGDELLRTVLRTSEEEVRKKRYEPRKTG